MEAVRSPALKRGLGLIALGAASAAGYVIAARAAGAAGFPLDDAWIHQTYARNLGWYGQWAFIPGQPSAGSTSPLWTMLLALGYALHVDYAAWTLLLNALLLGVTAWLTFRLAEQHQAGRAAWWAGVLVALEWHLAWAAASGMETVLFCALVMAAWVTASTRAHPAWAGVLSGLSVWARPDGLTLLPAIAAMAWVEDGRPVHVVDSSRLARLARLAGGAALALIPYFLFNLALSGQWWPNTFFAKQAEYALLREAPLLRRVAQIVSAPLVGPLALLLPGIALGARRGWAPLAWAAVFLFSYALRLPVTYQHGRYLIPVIPVLAVVGVSGMAAWVRLNGPGMWRRVTSRAWVLGLGMLTLAFWGLGARALATDIRVIEGEMVTVAKWAAVSLPRETVVAAHDIGALGYFAEVQLIDLAGLISPDVIPALGDDERLWAFVRRGGAEYLITFPGWCPAFTRAAGVRPVFQTGPACDPLAPALHMTVYQLP